MAKKNYDTGRILTKVMAAVLAGLMILGVATTFIYYLVNTVIK